MSKGSQLNGTGRGGDGFVGMRDSRKLCTSSVQNKLNKLVNMAKK